MSSHVVLTCWLGLNHGISYAMLYYVMLCSVMLLSQSVLSYFVEDTGFGTGVMILMLHDRMQAESWTGC